MKTIFGDTVQLRTTHIIIGATIIVGALGGVYLLTKSFNSHSRVTDKKSRKKEDHIKCNICFKILNLEDVKSCVICCNCRKAICRSGKCSIWIPNESGWECQLCSLSSETRSKASEWLLKQTNENCSSPMSAKSELSNSEKEHHSDIDTHSETLSSIGIDRKQKIREFIEDTLANMLGGSLDDVSVGPVFQNKEYLPLWETENCPGVSHVKLKRLVEKIIEDTLRLPELLDYSGIPGRKNDGLPYFDPKKYQELLATAVLNKIVDSYNYEKKFDNTETSPNPDLDKNHNAVITTKDKSSSSSISSIEPRSDSSFSDPTIDVSRGDDLSPSNSCSNLYTDALNRNSIENETSLSNYLAEHKVPFPDLAIDSESASEDFVSVATSNGLESTWEDNWLFKKRKHGKDSPVSVGMLVPAPKEDIKALIGDKTTDEVSDLSEAGSDFDETECDLNANSIDFDPPNVRIQNKTVIGGKSPVGIFDELLEQTSLISSSSIPEGESAFTETKNDFVLGNDGLNDTENVKLNLRKANDAIDNEAINSNVTSSILQNSPPKKLLQTNAVDKFDEPIIEPPEDFTDDEKAIRSTQKERSSFSSNEALLNACEEITTTPTNNTNNKSEVNSTTKRNQKDTLQNITIPQSVTFSTLSNVIADEKNSTLSQEISSILTANNTEEITEKYEKSLSPSEKTSQVSISRTSPLQLLAATAIRPVFAVLTKASEVDDEIISLIATELDIKETEVISNLKEFDENNENIEVILKNEKESEISHEQDVCKKLNKSTLSIDEDNVIADEFIKLLYPSTNKIQTKEEITLPLLTGIRTQNQEGTEESPAESKESQRESQKEFSFEIPGNNLEIEEGAIFIPTSCTEFENKNIKSLIIQNQNKLCIDKTPKEIGAESKQSIKECKQAINKVIAEISSQTIEPPKEFSSGSNTSEKEPNHNEDTPSQTIAELTEINERIIETKKITEKSNGIHSESIDETNPEINKEITQICFHGPKSKKELTSTNKISVIKPELIDEIFVTSNDLKVEIKDSQIKQEIAQISSEESESPKKLTAETQISVIEPKLTKEIVVTVEAIPGISNDRKVEIKDLEVALINSEETKLPEELIVRKKIPDVELRQQQEMELISSERTESPEKLTAENQITVMEQELTDEILVTSEAIPEASYELKVNFDDIEIKEELALKISKGTEAPKGLTVENQIPVIKPELKDDIIVTSETIAESSNNFNAEIANLQNKQKIAQMSSEEAESPKELTSESKITVIETELKNEIPITSYIITEVSHDVTVEVDLEKKQEIAAISCERTESPKELTTENKIPVKQLDLKDEIFVSLGTIPEVSHELKFEAKSIEINEEIVLISSEGTESPKKLTIENQILVMEPELKDEIIVSSETIPHASIEFKVEVKHLEINQEIAPIKSEGTESAKELTAVKQIPVIEPELKDEIILSSETIPDASIECKVETKDLEINQEIAPIKSEATESPKELTTENQIPVIEPELKDEIIVSSETIPDASIEFKVEVKDLEINQEIAPIKSEGTESAKELTAVKQIPVIEPELKDEIILSSETIPDASIECKVETKDLEINQEIAPIKSEATESPKELTTENQIPVIEPELKDEIIVSSETIPDASIECKVETKDLEINQEIAPIKSEATESPKELTTKNQIPVIEPELKDEIIVSSETIPDASIECKVETKDLEINQEIAPIKSEATESPKELTTENQIPVIEPELKDEIIVLSEIIPDASIEFKVEVKDLEINQEIAPIKSEGTESAKELTAVKQIPVIEPELKYEIIVSSETIPDASIECKVETKDLEINQEIAPIKSEATESPKELTTENQIPVIEPELIDEIIVSSETIPDASIECKVETKDLEINQEIAPIKSEATESPKELTAVKQIPVIEPELKDEIIVSSETIPDDSIEFKNEVKHLEINQEIAPIKSEATESPKELTTENQIPVIEPELKDEIIVSSETIPDTPIEFKVEVKDLEINQEIAPIKSEATKSPKELTTENQIPVIEPELKDEIIVSSETILDAPIEFKLEVKDLEINQEIAPIKSEATESPKELTAENQIPVIELDLKDEIIVSSETIPDASIEYKVETKDLEINKEIVPIKSEATESPKELTTENQIPVIEPELKDEIIVSSETIPDAPIEFKVEVKDLEINQEIAPIKSEATESPKELTAENQIPVIEPELKDEIFVSSETIPDASIECKVETRDLEINQEIAPIKSEGTESAKELTAVKQIPVIEPELKYEIIVSSETIPDASIECKVETKDLEINQEIAPIKSEATESPKELTTENQIPVIEPELIDEIIVSSETIPDASIECKVETKDLEINQEIAPIKSEATESPKELTAVKQIPVIEPELKDEIIVSSETIPDDSIEFKNEVKHLEINQEIAPIKSEATESPKELTTENQIPVIEPELKDEIIVSSETIPDTPIEFKVEVKDLEINQEIAPIKSEATKSPKELTTENQIPVIEPELKDEIIVSSETILDAPIECKVEVKDLEINQEIAPIKSEATESPKELTAENQIPVIELDLKDEIIVSSETIPDASIEYKVETKDLEINKEIVPIKSEATESPKELTTENQIPVIEPELKDEIIVSSETIPDAPIEFKVEVKDLEINQEIAPIKSEATESPKELTAENQIPVIEPELKDEIFVSSETIPDASIECKVETRDLEINQEIAPIKSEATESPKELTTENQIPVIEPELKDAIIVSSETIPDASIEFKVEVKHLEINQEIAPIKSEAPESPKKLTAENQIPVIELDLKDEIIVSSETIPDASIECKVETKDLEINQEIAPIKSEATESPKELTTKNQIPVIEPVLKDEIIVSSETIPDASIECKVETKDLEINQEIAPIKSEGSESPKELTAENQIPVIELDLKDEIIVLSETIPDASIEFKVEVKHLEINQEIAPIKSEAPESPKKLTTENQISIIEPELKDEIIVSSETIPDASIEYKVETKDLEINQEKAPIKSEANESPKELTTENQIPVIEPELKNEIIVSSETIPDASIEFKVEVKHLEINQEIAPIKSEAPESPKKLTTENQISVIEPELKDEIIVSSETIPDASIEFKVEVKHLEINQEIAPIKSEAPESPKKLSTENQIPVIEPELKDEIFVSSETIPDASIECKVETKDLEINQEIAPIKSEATESPKELTTENQIPVIEPELKDEIIVSSETIPDASIEFKVEVKDLEINQEIAPIKSEATESPKELTAENQIPVIELDLKDEIIVSSETIPDASIECKVETKDLEINQEIAPIKSEGTKSVKELTTENQIPVIEPELKDEILVSSETIPDASIECKVETKDLEINQEIAPIKSEATESPKELTAENQILVIELDLKNEIIVSSETIPDTSIECKVETKDLEINQEIAPIKSEATESAKEWTAKNQIPVIEPELEDEIIVSSETIPDASNEPKVELKDMEIKKEIPLIISEETDSSEELTAANQIPVIERELRDEIFVTSETIPEFSNNLIKPELKVEIRVKSETIPEFSNDLKVKVKEIKITEEIAPINSEGTGSPEDLTVKDQIPVIERELKDQIIVPSETIPEASHELKVKVEDRKIKQEIALINSEGTESPREPISENRIPQIEPELKDEIIVISQTTAESPNNSNAEIENLDNKQEIELIISESSKSPKDLTSEDKTLVIEPELKEEIVVTSETIPEFLSNLIALKLKEVIKQEIGLICSEETESAKESTSENKIPVMEPELKEEIVVTSETIPEFLNNLIALKLKEEIKQEMGLICSEETESAKESTSENKIPVMEPELKDENVVPSETIPEASHELKVEVEDRKIKQGIALINSEGTESPREPISESRIPLIEPELKDEIVVTSQTIPEFSDGLKLKVKDIEIKEEIALIKSEGTEAPNGLTVDNQIPVIEPDQDEIIVTSKPIPEASHELQIEIKAIEIKEEIALISTEGTESPKEPISKNKIPLIESELKDEIVVISETIAESSNNLNAEIENLEDKQEIELIISESFESPKELTYENKTLVIEPELKDEIIVTSETIPEFLNNLIALKLKEEIKQEIRLICSEETKSAKESTSENKISVMEPELKNENIFTSEIIPEYSAELNLEVKVIEMKDYIIETPTIKEDPNEIQCDSGDTESKKTIVQNIEVVSSKEIEPTDEMTPGSYVSDKESTPLQPITELTEINDGIIETPKITGVPNKIHSESMDTKNKAEIKREIPQICSEEFESPEELASETKVSNIEPDLKDDFVVMSETIPDDSAELNVKIMTEKIIVPSTVTKESNEKQGEIADEKFKQEINQVLAEIFSEGIDFPEELTSGSSISDRGPHPNEDAPSERIAKLIEINEGVMETTKINEARCEIHSVSMDSKNKVEIKQEMAQICSEATESSTKMTSNNKIPAIGPKLRGSEIITSVGIHFESTNTDCKQEPGEVSTDRSPELFSETIISANQSILNVETGEDLNSEINNSEMRIKSLEELYPHNAIIEPINITICDTISDIQLSMIETLNLTDPTIICATVTESATELYFAKPIEVIITDKPVIETATIKSNDSIQNLPLKDEEDCSNLEGAKFEMGNDDSKNDLFEADVSKIDRSPSSESNTTDDSALTIIETTESIKTLSNSPKQIDTTMHKNPFANMECQESVESYHSALEYIPSTNNTNNKNDNNNNNSSNNDSTEPSIESSTILPTNECKINGSNKQPFKLENLKNTAFSKPLLGEEDVDTPLLHLLPGSIAEREHKKWYNAVEMPNNPYTPEAIKRRLSNSGSDKPIDIPNINMTLEKATSDEKLNRPADDVGPKSLQVVIGNNQPDYARYGRDYYINDAKQASGTRKRNQNNLDASSPESSTDSDRRINEKEVTQSNTLEEIVHRSSSLGDKRSDSEDIFQARPVRVEESNPILQKPTKLDYLSTADRDFYLIANEEISSLKSSASTSLSQNSLTPSEDSDTIRVYDLNKQETRIIKDDKVKTIPKINTTSDINKNRPTNLTFTSKNSVQLKAVTPTSLKFLQPKRKSFDPNRIMSLDSEITSTSPIFEGNNIITPTNGTEISPSKPVIEEDVASALPSVKALAQVFLSNISSRTSTAVNRPKIRYRLSASWQGLDVKQCMEMRNATKNEDSINSEASRDSYVPPYDRTYCPIESPATPPVTPQTESLENNVEIIEQPLNEIPEDVEVKNDKLENIVTNQVEQKQLIDIVESPTSDRPISPVLVPGLLKNNIAFFENLKNK